MARLVVLCTASSLLVACGSSTHKDLQNFVETTQAQAIKNSSIESLPDIKPYETYLYKAANRRDPFTPTLAIDEVAATAATNGIRPDPNRRKESLENYPLDSLRMVGTMQRAEQLWGILHVINDPDGGIHRIETGNYIGQNYGRIVQISEESIGLVEIIPNGLGGWREREASIALSEE